MDEKKLIALCAQGSEQAWADLVSSYTDYLYRIVHNRLRKHGSAHREDDVIEDILSDIFHDLAKSDFHTLKSFRGECSVHTWLAAIANRKVIDWLRRQQQSIYGSDILDRVIEEYSDDLLPESKQNAAEMHILLSHALDQLPDRERTMISLYFEEGITYAKIGEWFGMSESGVRKAISNALNTLRQSLKK